MRLAGVVATLVGLSLTAPLVANAQLSRPKIDTVGGHVVRVMNPGPTAWGDTNGWKLVLERTIQPKEGEAGELQRPYPVLRTSRGQYVVGDQGATAISLFAANGRFVRSLGRAGAGPGEYRNLNIALFNDSLIIQDGQLKRVTVMTLDGKVVRTFPAYTNSGANQLDIDEKGRLPVGVFDGKATSWAFFTLSGQALDTMRLPEAAPVAQWSYDIQGGHASSSIPFRPNNLHRLLRDGSVIYGSTGTYLFFVTRNGRDTVRMFGRNGVVGLPIPDTLRQSIFDRVTQDPGVRSVAKATDIPKRYTLWSSVGEDNAGNFWVRTGSGWVSSRELDVFARDGRFLGAVPLPFESSNVTILGDRIGVIDADADDLPRIRIYRIDRRGK